MTDLRDKIAAVLADHLTDDYVAGRCACGEKTDDGHSTHQADAVIRELGLRQETRHAVVPSVGIVKIIPETFTTAGDHRQETRYVTEWTADA